MVSLTPVMAWTPPGSLAAEWHWQRAELVFFVPLSGDLRDSGGGLNVDSVRSWQFDSRRLQTSRGDMLARFVLASHVSSEVCHACFVYILESVSDTRPNKAPGSDKVRKEYRRRQGDQTTT
jgi:hypothetical protein